jgi:hypothetical protein
MQIIENWTCVTGIVLAINQPVADTRAKIEMQVERTWEVEGFHSLLPEKPGDKISVNMPENFKSNDKTLRGRTITLPVRMVRKGIYFADSNWSLQDGSPLCRLR